MIKTIGHKNEALTFKSLPMRSKLLLLFLSVSSMTTIFGQERIWTKQSEISEVIAFEKEINPEAKFLSKNVQIFKDYYPLADKYIVTNPIIIQRKALVYLPIYAEYFYTPEDSVLRLASYDWEKDRFANFFDKQKLWEEECKKFPTYNKEYERIKSMLIREFGIPTNTDTKAKEVESERGKYLARETLWETESVYSKLNMIFESKTYRIRLTIYWKI